MRVLSVIDSLAPGGAERSLVELAPHLRTAGVVLEVAVLEQRDGFTEELRGSGITVHQLEPAGRAGRARQLARLIRAANIDLCHTTLFESDVAGRLAGALTRTPVVTTLASVRYGSEQYADPGLSTTKLRAAQALDIVTARGVRRFHAVSGSVADTMAPRLRVPRDRITVVPRGRDRGRLGYATPTRRRDARTLLGLGDEPMVLAIARHEHMKGLDVLVAAVPALLGDHPGLAVLVAGSEGRQSDSLRALVTELTVEGHVHLLGARYDVGDLLCAADVFALPSRREGFPGVVVEAMALATPLVVTDIPMTREAVPDDRYARFVPVGDATALAHALSEVLARPEEAAQRASVALDRFEEHFTIERVAAAMADLFAAAAAPSGTPEPPP